MVVYSREGGVVVVLDGIPEGGGVVFAEGHDLFGVAVADEVGLGGWWLVPWCYLGLGGVERHTSLAEFIKVSPISHSGPSPTANFHGREGW